MDSGSRTEGRPQILSAGVRKMIQSIKEVVGNHSDAEIYSTLKETNMDPNETAQKLLNQDTFHEVKRKRDKRKEVTTNIVHTAAQPNKHSELLNQGTLYNAHSDRNIRRGGSIQNSLNRGALYNAHTDRNIRRGGSNRNSFPDAKVIREFRVVKDNRTNHNPNSEIKPPVQYQVPSNELEVQNFPDKSSTTSSNKKKRPVGRHSSKSSNGITDSQPRQSRDVKSNVKKEPSENRRVTVPKDNQTMETKKANDPQPNSATSPVAGVYSSSSDPVHVPSPDSRPAANIGAIKCEVGAVGVHRLTTEISAKPSSTQSNSSSNSHLGRDVRSSAAISKSSQPTQTSVHVTAVTSISVTGSFVNYHHVNRQHQSEGHQKGEPELPEDLIFLEILPRLNSEDVLPMILVSKNWASFILHNGPGLMLFNQPENPIPSSILIAIEPIPDSILVGLSPETCQIFTQSTFQIVPIINSRIKPTFPLFTVRPKFIEKGEMAVVGSCSGIICFHIASASRFVMVNPLTKFYKEVSAPQNSILHFEACTKPNAAGFFYDESNKDMKIVQFLRWDLRANSLGLSGPNTIHALRVYSVQSGKWESVDLEAIKTTGYICGLQQTLPEPLANFVDPYDILPENCFRVDFDDYCLKPVPVFGGAELSSDCVCWIDKVGIRAQNNCIYVLDEQFTTWKEYTTVPDEVSKNVIFFCLDGGNIVVLEAGQRNLCGYNLFNSTTGALHHILSSPDCRLFPYVPTLFCIEGMNKF